MNKCRARLSVILCWALQQEVSGTRLHSAILGHWSHTPHTSQVSSFDGVVGSITKRLRLKWVSGTVNGCLSNMVELINLTVVTGAEPFLTQQSWINHATNTLPLFPYLPIPLYSIFLCLPPLLLKGISILFQWVSMYTMLNLNHCLPRGVEILYLSVLLK